MGYHAGKPIESVVYCLSELNDSSLVKCNNIDSCLAVRSCYIKFNLSLSLFTIMLTFSVEMQLDYENVNIVSIFIHYQLKHKWRRIPSRFFGIGDFPYLKLRIQDFKAKSCKIQD